MITFLIHFLCVIPCNYSACFEIQSNCWMSFGVTQLLGSYRVESAICVAQFAEKLGVRESCAAATNVACVAHKKLANRCWRRIAPLHWVLPVRLPTLLYTIYPWETRVAKNQSRPSRNYSFGTKSSVYVTWGGGPNHSGGSQYRLAKFGRISVFAETRAGHLEPGLSGLAICRKCVLCNMKKHKKTK